MDVKKYKKEDLYNVAESLTEENINELISNLLSTDDKVRYPSYLILKFRSEINKDIYEYWNNFVSMLHNNNSYSSIIGLGLISINTKWDKKNKINDIIDKYLSFCENDKLVTARLSIQGLINIINGTSYDEKICKAIVNKLININIKNRPETHIKVMTTDIVNILIEIEKEIHFKEIIAYLNNCLNENIIDKKLKQEIEKVIN